MSLRFNMGKTKSKLKLCRDEVDFLERHTSLDRPTIKTWYKGFKKNCPNGMLDKEQFVGLYKLFTPYSNTDEYCDHIFRTFDKDKDGTINFSEFLLAINVMGNGSVEEKLMWSFKMFDIDENGSIDLDEMTRVIQSIYDMLGPNALTMTDFSPEVRANAIFTKLDKNEDQRVTQQEFVRGCSKDQELKNLLTLNLMNAR